MTKEQALNLPFAEYMQWCHKYLDTAKATNPIMKIVLDSAANSGGYSFLEAMWAKTYWFHKNGY